MSENCTVRESAEAARQDLAGLEPEQVLAGVAGTVTLSISAGGSANAVEGGAGTASADPLIEIDPTYLLTHPGLTLEFSDDVGNGV